MLLMISSPVLGPPGREGPAAFRVGRINPCLSAFRPYPRRFRAARLRAAVDSDRPVVERLVHFWSNHFTVSVRQKIAVLGIAGAFEREAIRPHVTGRFEDMLVAVVSHPAMLLYLDNAQSIGPESRAGQRAKRGINENLARELMELHTLGVDGGYSQEDVTQLARILTGWSVVPGRQPNGGSFRF